MIYKDFIVKISKRTFQIAKKSLSFIKFKNREKDNYNSKIYIIDYFNKKNLK